MGVNRVTAVGDPADMWSWLWGPYLVPTDCVRSWRTDWNVRNVKLKCLKYWIEIPIQDWNGARWNVWRCGTSSRHIGPFRAITICITIVARDKKCRLARPRLSVSILVNTYRCLWLQQKLLKSCGGTFQTCRYKIICICSWLVNFHCLTHILTIKLMQQMGSDAIRWRLLTGRLLVGQIWFGTFEGRSTNVLYWGMIFNYGQFEWSTVEYSGWRLEWSHLEVSQTLATSGVMTFPNWPKMYPRDYESIRTIAMLRVRQISFDADTTTDSAPYNIMIWSRVVLALQAWQISFDADTTIDSAPWPQKTWNTTHRWRIPPERVWPPPLSWDPLNFLIYPDVLSQNVGGDTIARTCSIQNLPMDYTTKYRIAARAQVVCALCPSRFCTLLLQSPLNLRPFFAAYFVWRW